jgi:CxxC motif-containing protein (DUF1111 family)
MSARRQRAGGEQMLLLALLAVGCEQGELAARPEPGEELAGGATTVFDTSRDAFARPAANLLDQHRSAFFTGNTFFNRNWVTAPASTEGADGLGPTFNARSCSACHFKDGRGAPPDADEPFVGLLIRLSVPGEDEHGGPVPEPNYGGQFNHLSVSSVPAEGASFVLYESVAGRFDDGTPYVLQLPSYRFEQLAFGALAEDVMLSPRVAPAVFGLGLLATIPEQTLAALADPDDDDEDGISGRLNRVWDPKVNEVRVGRFGWKANQAGLEQQNSGALLGDIGISSPLFPGQDCPHLQLACQSAENGGAPEIDQAKIDFITLYTHLLAVPGRRDVGDPQVLRGKGLFSELGCASCHVPTLQTGPSDEFPELAAQTIHPFSDLLLHDMGDGLADGRPDFLATGNEWRTPPLWGVGLVGRVNGHTRFLHDGRARDLGEAILWHGGEAARAQRAFLRLTREEREALLRFLDSL